MNRKSQDAVFYIWAQKATGCFRNEFSLGGKKTEKICEMYEELKVRRTKAMKERMEKKGRNEICSKSQTLVFDLHSQSCLPTQTRARTNKTKTTIELVVVENLLRSCQSKRLKDQVHLQSKDTQIFLLHTS